MTTEHVQTLDIQMASYREVYAYVERLELRGFSLTVTATWEGSNMNYRIVGSRPVIIKTEPPAVVVDDGFIVRQLDFAGELTGQVWGVPDIKTHVGQWSSSRGPVKFDSVANAHHAMAAAGIPLKYYRIDVP